MVFVDQSFPGCTNMKMKLKRSQETHSGLTFVATGNETNGKYFLSETTVPAGDTGPPLHTHSHEDESFYLRKGKLIFTIEGEEIELNEGEFLNIEKGEKHTWKNLSDIDAELIVTFSPAGIENMFIEMDQDPYNLQAIGRKYGTEFEI